MTMSVLVSKFSKKKQEIRPQLKMGQRVKLSSVGRDSLLVMPHHSPYGTISKPFACYPESISVIRDGSKRPLNYHWSYWEAI